MPITGIAHAQITIPVGGEKEARAFYCGVLGLREIHKPESLAGRGGFWLDAFTLQIHVGVEDGVDRGRTKAHLAYLTDGLHPLREKLEALGFEIHSGPPLPGFTRFETRDPFGNRIEFMQKEELG